ncbi:Ankyrin repeat-containing protein [Morus notabilis]|uniref:Ankyrin repeat-containing protein n=1 Tax=Morus notabilis TaxID=981085 RepID=W9RQ28_9ROSA|nr:Ankyrin repeat-containing protein [Morus notabilis]
MIRKYSSALVEQDNLGWTCLHYAARYGVEEVVVLFLENDKSCSYIRDKEGLSAFHIATKQGEVEIIRQIMTFCPDISELLTCNGQNALHVAVKTRKENAVEYLLTTLGSNGFLNKQDEDGNTLFHLAAIIEDYEILELIIYMVRRMVLNNEKVNQNVMNKDGLTVMDIIQSCNTLEDSRKEGIISELRGVDCVPGLKRQLIERNTQLQNVEKIKGVPQPQLENKLVEESKSTNLLTKLFFQPFINPRHTKRAAEVDIVLATLIAAITFAAATKAAVITPPIAKLTTFYSILAMVGTFFSALHLVSENSKGIYIASYACLAAFLIGPFYLKYFDFLSWIKGCLPYAFVCVLLLFFVVGVIGLVVLFFFRIIHFHLIS